MQLVAAYNASGLVQFAEPDYLVHAYGVRPDDPAYLDGKQWALENLGQEGGLPGADIRAPSAWELRTSASNVVVAILDTGIRSTHEDLAANLWVNPSDGTHGFNALDESHFPDDDSGHGTQVAGVLGAVGNNGKGITGVAWQVQIMSCKALDLWGSGSDATVIASLEFALTNGARIVNASLGGMDFSEAVSNAIVNLRNAGVILVAPCGNSRGDVDLVPRYPACYAIDNVVSVAYTTREDVLGPISNYGATNVDLAAPGDELFSTHSESDTSYAPTNYPLTGLVGTSFAAAHVSGALALMIQHFPEENYKLILGRLMDAVDVLPDLQGKVATGGRLNLRKALSHEIRLVPIDCSLNEPQRLDVICGPNRTCIVETATDFSSWAPVATNFSGCNRSFYYTNTFALTDESSRFFRVISKP